MTDAAALAVFDFGPAGAAAGYRLVDPGTPQLTVTELAATRGDGVFETVGVVDGRPLKVARHLARLQQSARMLDLPAQDVAVWDAAVREVAAALPASADSYVKLVLSRGDEVGEAPTGWAYARTHHGFSDLQREGLRVVLLDRGYPHDVAQRSPWLLQGAKTLSYAVNRASHREAVRRGADDVVYLASDGYLLEGPTSTIMLRTGRTLRTSRTDIGILAGTTQAELFEWGAEQGYECVYDLLTPEDLADADAAWLVSSLRLAVPVRSVEGVPKIVDAGLTAAFNTHLRSLGRVRPESAGETAS